MKSLFDQFVTWFRGLIGLDTALPREPNLCDAAACANARRQRDVALASFENICRALQTLKTLTEALRGAFFVPWWTLVLIIALAVLIGGPLGLLLWGLVGPWALAMAAYFVLGLVASGLEPALAQRGQEFGTAR